MALRPRRTWLQAKLPRPAPVSVPERVYYAARPDACPQAGDPAGFGCEGVNEGEEDSPTARSETISEVSARWSGTTPRRQPPVSDDLVSVDRHGKVTVESGSGAGRAIYWALKNVLLGPAIARIFRPVMRGRRTSEYEGAAIVASNHLSFADWLFMPLALDRRITFVAKSELLHPGWHQGLGTEGFFAGTGQVPIDRSGGRAVRALSGPG